MGEEEPRELKKVVQEDDQLLNRNAPAAARTDYAYERSGVSLRSTGTSCGQWRGKGEGLGIRLLAATGDGVAAH